MFFHSKKRVLVFFVCTVAIFGYMFSAKIWAVVVATLNLNPSQTAMITCAGGTLRVANYGATGSKEVFCDSLGASPSPSPSVTPAPSPSISPTPAPSPSPSVAPTPAPSPSPTITPTPAPPASIPPFEKTAGLWISPEEIAALPTSGGGWSGVQSAANGSWGTANLGDNNSDHDVKTLAGALVAAKTGDQAMRAKVIDGLHSAMGSGTSRALELSRGLQAYIIAADIIGYRDPAFMSWVREMLNKNVSGHSGGTGVLGTAEKSANNWGGHARASGIAGALYLEDAAMIESMKNAHLGFIGVSAPHKLSFTGTDWHAGSPEAGVNVKGATKNGVNISGVLPEDWRRAAGFKWPPSTSGYMWEGMQGFVVSAVLLHRAGLVPFNAGDNAVVRAMDILYGTGEAAQNSPKYSNPASGDDTWIPWVVNHYAGTNYPTSGASSGKNMGWTDWTHQ